MRHAAIGFVFGLLVCGPVLAGDPAVETAQQAQSQREGQQQLWRLQHPPAARVVRPSKQPLVGQEGPNYWRPAGQRDIRIDPASAASPAAPESVRREHLNRQQRAAQQRLHERQHRQLLYDNQRARTALPGQQVHPKSRLPLHFRGQQRDQVNRFRSQQRTLVR